MIVHSAVFDEFILIRRNSNASELRTFITAYDLFKHIACSVAYTDIIQALPIDPVYQVPDFDVDHLKSFLDKQALLRLNERMLKGPT